MANWDLFREMDNLRREIDEAFRGFGSGRGLDPVFLPGLGTGRYPQVNLSEDQDNLYVEALVPGLEAKDIELTVMRGMLTLSGERKASEGPKKTWHRNERGAGKFLRTVELPVEVAADKVKAEYKNGVLTVALPKHEAARPKKVEVKVG